MEYFLARLNSEFPNSMKGFSVSNFSNTRIYYFFDADVKFWNFVVKSCFWKSENLRSNIYEKCRYNECRFTKSMKKKCNFFLPTLQIISRRFVKQLFINFFCRKFFFTSELPFLLILAGNEKTFFPTSSFIRMRSDELRSSNSRNSRVRFLLR